MSNVKYDKRIYKLKAVKAAVKDYKEFADFQISTSGNEIIVDIANIDYEAEDVFLDEFGNYVIHKMGMKI